MNSAIHLLSPHKKMPYKPTEHNFTSYSCKLPALTMPPKFNYVYYRLLLLATQAKWRWHRGILQWHFRCWLVLKGRVLKARSSERYYWEMVETSGGGGGVTRHWPLKRDVGPQHFLLSPLSSLFSSPPTPLSLTSWPRDGQVYATTWYLPMPCGTLPPL